MSDGYLLCSRHWNRGEHWSWIYLTRRTQFPFQRSVQKQSMSRCVWNSSYLFFPQQGSQGPVQFLSCPEVVCHDPKLTGSHRGNRRSSWPSSRASSHSIWYREGWIWSFCLSSTWPTSRTLVITAVIIFWLGSLIFTGFSRRQVGRPFGRPWLNPGQMRWKPVSPNARSLNMKHRNPTPRNVSMYLGVVDWLVTGN